MIEDVQKVLNGYRALGADGKRLFRNEAGLTSPKGRGVRRKRGARKNTTAAATRRTQTTPEPAAGNES